MARFARKDSERGQTPRGSSGSCVVRVHDGDDGVVGAAPRAHEHVLQMEKPMAEPGAFAAGRIAGQAHDGVPQLGEAFRQILFMRAAASRAPVRASGRKPPGSGQPPGTVLKSSASRCDVRVSSIWVSVDCKTGWRRYRRKWLPRAPPGSPLPCCSRPLRAASRGWPGSCGNGAHVSRLLLSCSPGDGGPGIPFESEPRAGRP